MGAVKEEMVRILMELTADVERFDAMVSVHRRMIEQRPGGADSSEDDRLSWQAQRLGEEAKEIVARSRQALLRLRRLST